MFNLPSQFGCRNHIGGWTRWVLNRGNSLRAFLIRADMLWIWSECELRRAPTAALHKKSSIRVGSSFSGDIEFFSQVARVLYVTSLNFLHMFAPDMRWTLFFSFQRNTKGPEFVLCTESQATRVSRVKSIDTAEVCSIHKNSPFRLVKQFSAQ